VSHILPVDTTVTAYFDTPLTPVFLLNDPVKGKLDDPTYILAGDIATDITADVTAVSVRRGRSRWLDDITVGTASFTVNNEDRDYDPLGAGAYSDNIVPGKRVTINVGGSPIFDGTIDDWDLTYTLGGKANATAVASDALADLGRKSMTAHTATAQLSGARVNAVLDRTEVNYPAGSRNIDVGAASLQADVVDAGDNVLDYLKRVARTETGRVFAARDGVLTFQQRSDPVPSAGAPLFTDDSSGIPYDTIEVEVGSELLFNRATVTRLGGVEQVADNTDSQALYDIRTLNRTGLLFDADSAAADLAEYIVAKYGDPTPRFATVAVNIAALTIAQAASVAELEIGDLVQVTFSPPGGGTAIDDYGIVEGIRHDVAVDRHRVSFSLSSLLGSPFVLDDTAFGQLDTGGTLAL